MPLLTALVEAPSRLWDLAFGPLQSMPALIYILFFVGMAIMQFVAIFWFMSKGGVDTYMPAEVKTRFADVWGQDHVLERVQENIVFLEKPEEIESKGGHVPGGILLWGPPGTGKTLMAEAVAGETGRPYVFVDPGAFQNMFFGVGILKVKSLFRKLRKLSLRYGGVIVFFDEADSLGSRGGAVAKTPVARLRHDDGVRHAPLQRRALPVHAGGPHDASRRPVRPVATADDARARAASRAIVMSPAMGGGGGMGTLQALLTELSGLKKPRGFFSRRLRQFFNIKPKQPPKYRILVMMATNMPDSLDQALLRPGRIDRIYRVGYPSKDGPQAHLRGLPRQGEARPHRRPDRQAGHRHAVRDGRHHQGPRERVAHRGHAQRPRHHHLGRRDRGQEAEERRAVGERGVHRARAPRHRHPRGLPRGHVLPGAARASASTSPPSRRARASSASSSRSRWRSASPSGAPPTRPTCSSAWRRWPASGCSSAATTRRASAATCASATTLIAGHGGPLGHGLHHRLARGLAGAGQRGPVSDGRDRNVLETQLGRRAEDRLRAALPGGRGASSRRTAARCWPSPTPSRRTRRSPGEDIEAIIEGRQGPLVDGRPYVRPEFLADAEAYHEVALAAHRRQSSIDIAAAGPGAAWPPARNGHAPWAPPDGRPATATGTATATATPATGDGVVSEPVSPATGWGVLHLFCKPTPLVDGEAVVAAVKAAEAADHQVVPRVDARPQGRPRLHGPRP